MRQGTAIVTLCLLLALAGCSAFSGTAADEKPGIEDGELVDAGALLDAHTETLTESGYSHELSVNQTRVDNGDTVETTRRQRTRVAAGGSEYTYQLINSGEANSWFWVWGNETTQYQRIEAGGNPQFHQSKPAGNAELSGARTLEAHLSAPYEVVDTEEREETTLVTLEATAIPESAQAFPSNAESIRAYDARLVVDEEGRIRKLSVDATYDIDGETAEYDLEYELTALDDPGVERPSWVQSLGS